MTETQGTHLRLMTYNIGGGRKDSRSIDDKVIEVIQNKDEPPDVLVLQEAVELEDRDRNVHNTASEIARKLEPKKDAFELTDSTTSEITDKLKHMKDAFGPTVSLDKQFHPGNTIFIKGIFNDWRDWQQGNAILSWWEFARLGDPSKAGEPRNLPLFSPLRYEGSRDTDPRHALIGRINTGAVSPFIIGTHLTTLRGERYGSKLTRVWKTRAARKMRVKQVRRLVQIIKENVLDREELVFLMGDFNASANEPCIADVLMHEAGFVRLIPENDDIFTHLSDVDKPIDHIFVYPRSRLLDYECRIVDSVSAQQASDHLPVMADVVVI